MLSLHTMCVQGDACHYTDMLDLRHSAIYVVSIMSTHLNTSHLNTPAFWSCFANIMHAPECMSVRISQHIHEVQAGTVTIALVAFVPP